MPPEEVRQKLRGTVMPRDIAMADIVFHESIKRDSKDCDVVFVTINPVSEKTFIFEAGYPAYQRFQQAGEATARCLVLEKPLSPGAYTLLTKLTKLVRGKSRRAEQVPLLKNLQQHHEFTYKALAYLLGVPEKGLGAVFSNDKNRKIKRKKTKRSAVERVEEVGSTLPPAKGDDNEYPASPTPQPMFTASPFREPPPLTTSEFPYVCALPARSIDLLRIFLHFGDEAGFIFNVMSILFGKPETARSMPEQEVLELVASLTPEVRTRLAGSLRKIHGILPHVLQLLEPRKEVEIQESAGNDIVVDLPLRDGCSGNGTNGHSAESEKAGSPVLDPRIGEYSPLLNFIFLEGVGAMRPKPYLSQPEIRARFSYPEDTCMHQDVVGAFKLLQECWDVPRTPTIPSEYQDFLTFISRVKKAFPGVPPSFDGWINRVIAKGKGHDPLPLRRILSLPSVSVTH